MQVAAGPWPWLNPISQRYQRVIVHNNTNNNSYSSWNLVQQVISQGSILDPLFFLFIKDVPIISKNDTLVLYAEDASIAITSPSSTEFSTEVSTVLADINEWFKSNLLSLNLEKTHFLQFQSKYSQKFYLNITLLNKHFINTTNIKFLVMTIGETLSWSTLIIHCQGWALHSALLGLSHCLWQKKLNDISFVYSLNYNLWYNFWSKFTAQ